MEKNQAKRKGIVKKIAHIKIDIKLEGWLSG